MPRPSLGLTIIVLVAIALALRLWELGDRAFHHDESLDAWWSWRFRNGDYTGYDPVYHGPLRFYITAGFYEIFGENEMSARLFSALSGAAAVGLPWYLRHELGKVATVAASVALCISPTMLYYSRFGREDAQMVFLALLTLVLVLAWLREPRISVAAGLGFVLAASFAIKESTYLFVLLLAMYALVVIAAQFDRRLRGLDEDQPLSPTFFAAGLTFASLGLTAAVVIGAASDELFIALILLGAIMVAFTAALAANDRRRARDAGEDPDAYEWPPALRALGAIGVPGWAATMAAFSATWLVCFTVFGTRPGDWASGFTKAIDYWDSQQEVNRGGQPWYYYLYALPIYEWFFVVLAGVGTWRTLRRPTVMTGMFVWFSVGSLIIYSYAGERMPWLIAHPLLPMLLLAGLGTAVLWQNRSRNFMPLIAALCMFGLLATTATSLRSSFPNGTDSREILSQAGQATPHLTAALERFDNIDRLKRQTTGEPAILAIEMTDGWPWSWYLRGNGNVRWFSKEQAPCLPGSQTAPEPDVVCPEDWVAPFDVVIAGRDTLSPEAFPTYSTTQFAMRSWWVPTYTDASIRDWISYARGRHLWEQNPNPNFVGVGEVVEGDQDGLLDSLGSVGDGISSAGTRWVDFAANEGDLIAPPVEQVEPDDGRDGCGSVDQWFMVFNDWSTTERQVYPEAVESMGPLDCASDAFATS